MRKSQTLSVWGRTLRQDHSRGAALFPPWKWGWDPGSAGGAGAAAGGSDVPLELLYRARGG